MTATCPVCGAGTDSPFLVRDPVPVHQNLIVSDVASARALRRGSLRLHACEQCGFVFNAAFDPRLLRYGASYDNTQSCSPAFEDYLERLADYLVKDRGVHGCHIVEIGCGKGDFLRALVRRDPANWATGFDPSFVGPEVIDGGRVRFERRFYDSTCNTSAADIVVCRHVIEHIPDPVALLHDVRQTLGSARMFVETPCAEWIFDNDVVWDVFYEHCSYFTESSLATAFARAGFAVEEIRHTFGGQYLWAEARSVAGAPPMQLDGGRVSTLARRFAAHEAILVTSLCCRLAQLRSRGEIAIWGGAAKGVTLANLIDPECQLIACVVDLNPNKRGARLPGTGHPIVGPHELPTYNVRSALLTNPNYFEENVRLLRDASLDVELIDLMRQGVLNAPGR